MEKIEGNKIIAEFMGVKTHTKFGAEIKNHQYHTSWDWLMPVIEKIRSLSDNPSDSENGLAYSTITVYLEANGHALGGAKNKYRASLLGNLVFQRMVNSYQHTFDTIKVPLISETGESGIEVMYKIIVQFITWYNSLTSKEEKK